MAGGESLYTRYGFRDLLSTRALDIVQPDVCCAGGISEVKKIAMMANTCGIQCCPPVWGNGVAIAAATHLEAMHDTLLEKEDASPELVTIQDLLGHSWITTTERYCRVSNLKVQRDYFRAMDKVIKRKTYGQSPT